MGSFTDCFDSFQEIDFGPWMRHWFWKHKKGFSIIVAAILLMLFGALIFWGIEKDAYKKRGFDLTYLDSLYFAVATATSIGFGDIVPITTGAKVFVVIFLIVSISLFTYGLGAVATHVVNTIDKKISKNLPEVMRRSLAANLNESPSTDVIIEDAVTHNNKKADDHSFMNKKVFKMWMRFINWFHPFKRYIIAIMLNTVLVLIGAGLFVAAEDWTYGDAVYFCTITLATVGYGDFTPRTNGGKFLFIVYALFSFATIGFIYGEIAAATGAQIAKSYEQRFQESVTELPVIQDQLYQQQQQKKEKNAKEVIAALKTHYEKLPNSNDQQYFLQLVEEFLNHTKPQ